MNEQEHEQFHLSAARAASRLLDGQAPTEHYDTLIDYIDEQIVGVRRRQLLGRMRDLHIEAAGKTIEQCKFNHDEGDEVTP